MIQKVSPLHPSAQNENLSMEQGPNNVLGPVAASV